MRVAVVFWDVPRDWGGNYVFAQTILGALRAARRETEHEFVFYSTPPPGVTGPMEEPDVIRIPTQEEPEPPKGRFRRRPQPEQQGGWFDRSLDEREIDLVWFAGWHAEDCERPFIFTVLDIEYLRQPWYPEVSAQGSWDSRHDFLSRYVPRATRVIVPNQAGAEQVMRYFHIEQERLLPLHHPTPPFALDAGRGDPLGRDRIGAIGIGEAPYLLYTAKFWAHKNHRTVLEALAELNRDRAVPYELVLVGTTPAWGGQLENVKSMADELGLTDQVHFTGYATDEQLIALYQHAHAFLYASMFGSENLPPLEAMALGCPAVVADIPGAAEQFGEAAMRVPASDAVAFAEAVNRLEDPALRGAQIEAGRELARGRTPERYIRGVIDFLDEFEHTNRSWASWS